MPAPPIVMAAPIVTAIAPNVTAVLDLAIHALPPKRVWPSATRL